MRRDLDEDEGSIDARATPERDFRKSARELSRGAVRDEMTVKYWLRVMGMRGSDCEVGGKIDRLSKSQERYERLSVVIMLLLDVIPTESSLLMVELYHRTMSNEMKSDAECKRLFTRVQHFRIMR